jgi:hypothetical protein
MSPLGLNATETRCPRCVRSSLNFRHSCCGVASVENDNDDGLPNARPNASSESLRNQLSHNVIFSAALRQHLQIHQPPVGSSACSLSVMPDISAIATPFGMSKVSGPRRCPARLSPIIWADCTVPTDRHSNGWTTSAASIGTASNGIQC